MSINHSNVRIDLCFPIDDHKLIQMKNLSLLSKFIIYARLSLLFSTCGDRTGNDSLILGNQAQMRLFQLKNFSSHDT